MPSSELMLEYAADCVEPIFDPWLAYGTFASMYSNVHREKNSKPTKPSDWIPRIMSKPRQTAKQMASTVRSFCRSIIKR